MRAILDASTLLAVVFDEPVADDVRSEVARGGSLISIVNLAEAATRLQRVGHGALARSLVPAYMLAVAPLTEEMAYTAAELAIPGRSLGLSLADRCCLATAHAFNATALTTDHAWLDLPSPWRNLVRCVRRD